MQNKVKTWGWYGLGIATIGIFLSFLLILEYFGSDSSLAQGLCGLSGDSDSCKQVAESNYSAIRGIPGFGDIPIALLGFCFYGALAFGFFRIATSKSETPDPSFGLLTVLVGIGILVDIILLGISLLLIGTLCMLCAMTYLVTLGSGFVLYQILKKEGRSLFSDFSSSLKAQGLNFAIALLAFFAVGLTISKSLSGESKSLGNSSGQSSEIRTFETSPVLNIDTTGASSRGSAEAPITIVKFADFNCGHCMHASHILSRVLDEFDGLVRVVYMNFPLDGNCNRLVGRKSDHGSSCIAASAAICGTKQGRFVEVYKGLYQDTENGVMHSGASVINVASKSGLNLAEFKTCMSSSSVTAQINREVDAAEKLNIQSTPSLFINGRALRPGTPDPAGLRELIKYLISKS
jgi:protein-disulfide isomerase/uncharacterized membrane protein